MKFFLSLLLLTVSSSVFALRPAVTTKCMVDQADAIVVARFTSSSKAPIYRDRLGDLYLANFRNLGSFKGFGIEMNELKDYSLLWRKGNAEYPKFLPGKTYLLYLKYSEIGPFVLHGSRGAVQIDNQSISEIKDVRKFLRKPISVACD